MKPNSVEQAATGTDPLSGLDLSLPDVDFSLPEIELEPLPELDIDFPPDGWTLE